MNSTVTVTNRLRDLIVELEVKKTQAKNEKIIKKLDFAIRYW